MIVDSILAESIFVCFFVGFHFLFTMVSMLGISVSEFRRELPVRQ